MSTKFREDIQGIRGFALILIVLFHAGIMWFPGAFLAVDVFFVISGYLITGILLRQQESGSFSYSVFLMRRIRRLMPAAVVTVFATLIVCFFVFSSADYEALGLSALAAIFSVVNILFWQQTGYYDAAVYTKPFLHYWSLSVEEQFYLVWPLVVAGAAKLGRRPLVMAVVIGGFLVSLLGAEFFAFDRNPAAAFFLTPFRVFEFMIGAIISVAGLRVTAKYWREIVYLVGIALMLFGLLAFNEHDRMPGFLSLFTLVGCAMIIATPDARLAFLLKAPPVVYIGTASYSLYLAHWPVTALLKYTIEVDLSPFWQVVAIISTFPAGLLLYHFVEKPFRKEETWKMFGRFAKPTGIGGLALVSIFATTVWLGDGFRFRFPNSTGVEFDPVAMRDLTKAQQAENNRKPLSEEHTNFYVIGDSMGADVSVMISLLRPEATVHHYWVGGRCQGLVVDYDDPKIKKLSRNRVKANVDCNQPIAEAFDPEKLAKYDVIVLATRWSYWAAEYLPDTFAKIRETTSAPVITIGLGPMFTSDVPVIIETAQRLKDVRYLHGRDRVGVLEYQNKAIEKGTLALGGLYLDKFELLCPRAMCQVLDLDDPKEPYYSDFGHLTMSGEHYWRKQVEVCKTDACSALKTLGKLERTAKKND